VLVGFLIQLYSAASPRGRERPANCEGHRPTYHPMICWRDSPLSHAAAKGLKGLLKTRLSGRFRPPEIGGLRIMLAHRPKTSKPRMFFISVRI